MIKQNIHQKLGNRKRGILTCLVIILIGINISYGQVLNKQNTYLDALRLSKIAQQNRGGLRDNSAVVKAFYDLLENYGVYDTNINNNIFLKDFALQLNPKGLEIGGISDHSIIKFNVPEVSEVLPNTEGWQAAVINGVASFMAGRFKQEVLHMAINGMFENIVTEKDSQIIKAVFPSTFKQIDQLYKAESGYYTADLLLIRQTAQMDLQDIPSNILRNPKFFFPSLEQNVQATDALLLGGYLVQGLQDGQSIDRLLTYLAEEQYSSNSDLRKVLDFADFISQALLDTMGSKSLWVNPTRSLKLSTFTKDRADIRYFYGLLYAQLKQNPEFGKYLDAANGDMYALAAKMEELLYFINRLSYTYTSIVEKAKGLISPADVVSCLNGIQGSLQSVCTILNDAALLDIDKSIFDITGKYILLAETILEKKYNEIIPVLLTQFSEYLPSSVKTSRSLMFLSQLSAVDSAEALEELLNSYALPIGSSSIKRHSSFNLSVNGYVGLTGGLETAYGSAGNQTKLNVGLTAPIGVSTTCMKGHFTAFVSFIDLGSVVNQRLKNDTISYTDFKLEHFFTPGLGLYYNSKKYPISAGLHFNYVPNLRTIKYDNQNAVIGESNTSVTRLNLSLLIDIPFFTLYNKQD